MKLRLVAPHPDRKSTGSSKPIAGYGGQVFLNGVDVSGHIGDVDLKFHVDAVVEAQINIMPGELELDVDAFTQLHFHPIPGWRIEIAPAEAQGLKHVVQTYPIPQNPSQAIPDSTLQAIVEATEIGQSLASTMIVDLAKEILRLRANVRKPVFGAEGNERMSFAAGYTEAVTDVTDTIPEENK
jgi:hypothetical protein